MLLPARDRLVRFVTPQSSDNILFVQTLEQASHGGEYAAAVEAAAVTRADVTELGTVLTGKAEGRQRAEEVTLFDSTGLAIQDLAIAKVAYAKAGDLDLPTLTL